MVEKLSVRAIRFFDKCCSGNYNSNDASEILGDIKALETVVDNVQKLPEKWRDKRTHDQLMYDETPENYTLTHCDDELEETAKVKKNGFYR
jgi:hypothetical protein